MHNRTFLSFLSIILIAVQIGILSCGPEAKRDSVKRTPFFSHWQQGVGPWNLSDHYIDNKTGITLTLYSLDNELSNFAPNFRGLHKRELPFQADQFRNWEIEYFCEPDWVLGVYGPENSALYYLNSLRMKKSLYIREDGVLFLSYRYRPEMGLLHEGRTAIPYPAEAPDVEMEITFRWVAGRNNVGVTISITNLIPEPRNFCIVIQDAAFMWFPDGNQSDVQGTVMDISTNRVDNSVHQGEGVVPWVAGSFSKSHGVFAGFRPTSCEVGEDVRVRTAVGVVGRYVLVPKNIPVGYQLVPPDLGRDFDSMMRAVSPYETNQELINRFILFRLDNVAGKSSTAVRFQMIMGMLDAFQGDVSVDQVEVWASP